MDSATYWSLATLAMVHWLGDFVFQSDRMAKDKAHNILVLLSHVITYGSILSIAAPVIGILIFVFNGIEMGNMAAYMLLFLALNIIAHGATDFVTSKVSSYFYGQKQIHNFFVVIGFDQMIHGLTLLTTYYYLLAH